MKRLLYILLALTFCACEVIDESDRLIPVPLPVSSEHRHVLLEFTGVGCVNCPLAAVEAHNLKALYGENLILVSLHPASNHFTQAKDSFDYTCPAADSVYKFMGGEIDTPFPTGNVDATKRSNAYFASNVDWPAWLQTALLDTVAPYLSVTAHADSLTRQVTINAQYTQNDNLQLSNWLVEDSVLGGQRMPDGSFSRTYYHRHVLRAITAQTTLTIPQKCNLAHCSIVSMLVDKNDKHILQAYETVIDFRAHR